MTKPHFEALAQALKQSKPVKSAPQLSQWRKDVKAVADVCEKANIRFSRALFYSACGSEDDSI